MQTLKQVQAHFFAQAPLVSGVETVDLDDALGRVLAEDVVSPIDIPGFDNSAMDGIALQLPREFVG